MSAAAATALLLLSACSAGGDTPKEPSGEKTSTASAPANVLHDELPEPQWNKPLGKNDVTNAQLKKWIEQEKLPEAPSTGGLETMLNSVAFRDTAPDVAFFGDSMTQQGIDPQTMSKELTRETGHQTTAFNVASSRARWGVNKLVAKYLERHDRVPKVAVLVISTRAAEGDLYYKKDIAHTPLSSVVEGCERQKSTLWTAKDVANCTKDRSDLRHRFRTAGAQVERAQDGKQATTSWRVDEDSILRSDGYLGHPGVSKAEVQKVADKRSKRGFPGFPTVDDQAVKDFRETKEILERNGATVISAEIPYPPPRQKNLDEVGRDYDKRRQAAAKELAEKAGVKHHPVKSFGSWWGDGDSRDALHLAPQGAASFSKQLVNDVPGFRDDVVAGLED